MRILFVGDVVGKPGRQAVTKLVPALRRERRLDFIIVNGENSAHGAGLTAATVSELLLAGVDVVTSGDHVWDQKGFEQDIGRFDQVIRPINFPSGAPGRGSVVVNLGDRFSVGVINVLGRVYLPVQCDCPFRTTAAEVERLRQQTPIIVVDFHAEATSEKIALGRYLDGRVSLLVGTHTHVQTADEQIWPGGTAFLSDAGMCGPHESVLGREIAPVIRRFLTQLPQKLEVASGNVKLCGVIVEVEESTGHARTVERIQIPVNTEP
jgi:metallophosphoesterase (TIGR00282 family)